MPNPSDKLSEGEGVAGSDPQMLTPKRLPEETLRNFIARTIALHGLGTVNGVNRWRPPTMEWSCPDWERHVLECIPQEAKRKCFLLADVLLDAALSRLTKE